MRRPFLSLAGLLAVITVACFVASFWVAQPTQGDLQSTGGVLVIAMIVSGFVGIFAGEGDLVFESFTGRARHVITLSQETARLRGLRTIDTRCLVAGVLGEEEGLGARVLLALGVSSKDLWGSDDLVTAGDSYSGQLPFTDAAKKALELALREVLALGHHYITTEHIVLGLARADDSWLGEKHGYEKVRREVDLLLGSTRPRPKPDSAPVVTGGGSITTGRTSHAVRETAELIQGEWEDETTYLAVHKLDGGLLYIPKAAVTFWEGR